MKSFESFLKLMEGFFCIVTSSLTWRRTPWSGWYKTNWIRRHTRTLEEHCSSNELLWKNWAYSEFDDKKNNNLISFPSFYQCNSLHITLQITGWNYDAKLANRAQCPQLEVRYFPADVTERSQGPHSTNVHSLGVGGFCRVFDPKEPEGFLTLFRILLGLDATTGWQQMSQNNIVTCQITARELRQAEWGEHD